ncbi:unnamed protein product [Pleuronectes platessa]|uniref:Uncharacterized protein n=1 Tax=Pleuronectes platessa TaxID=8262 RepID=A0A9N7VIJ4_PLEPL|nr:unnamed protein product [Pleuronectes platessa]
MAASGPSLAQYDWKCPPAARPVQSLLCQVERGWLRVSRGLRCRDCPLTCQFSTSLSDPPPPLHHLNPRSSPFKPSNQKPSSYPEHLIHTTVSVEFYFQLASKHQSITVLHLMSL